RAGPRRDRARREGQGHVAAGRDRLAGLAPVRRHHPDGGRAVTAVGPVHRPRLGSPAHRALYGWQERAECRGEELEMFFSADHEAEAKAVCGWCPVRDECLDWAIELNTSHGVYG